MIRHVRNAGDRSLLRRKRRARRCAGRCAGEGTVRELRTRRERRCDRALREPQVRLTRNDRQRALHRYRLDRVQLRGRDDRRVAEAAVLEVLARDRRERTVHFDVAIVHVVVDDRRVVHDRRCVRAPPRVERFIRCERHPADVAETDADAHRADVEADETDECGAPGRRDARRSRRIPGPVIVGRAEIPAAIVIRSPAPRFGGDPRPAVAVFPNPIAVAIRCPARRDHRRNPDVTVRAVIDPAPVVREVADTLNVRVHVLALSRGRQIDMIAVAVIGIETVECDRGLRLNLRIRGRAVGDERRAGLQRLIALRRHDVGPSGAHGHRRLAVLIHGNAEASGRARNDGDRRRVDRRLTVGITEKTQVDRTGGELHLTVGRIDVDETDLHVFAEAHGRAAIEADFRAAVLTGRYVIRAEYRGIRNRREGGVVVAALDRNVARERVDARHRPGCGLRGGVILCECRQRKRRRHQE